MLVKECVRLIGQGRRGVPGVIPGAPTQQHRRKPVALGGVGYRRTLHRDGPREGEVDIVHAGLRVVQPVQAGFRAELQGVASQGLRKVAVEVVHVFTANDQRKAAGADRLVRLRGELRRNGRIPRTLNAQRGWSEVALGLARQGGISELAGPSPPQAQHRGGTDRASVIERGIVGVGGGGVAVGTHPVAVTPGIGRFVVLPDQAEAEGNPLLLVEVVIDLGRLLKAVGDVGAGEEVVAGVREREPRQIGIGVELDGGHGNRVKPRSRNHVARKGRSQRGSGGGADAVGIVDLHQLPVGVQALAEVPVLFQDRWKGLRRGGLGRHLGAFVVEEEEGLVAAVVDLRNVDRTADRSPELVLP